MSTPALAAVIDRLNEDADETPGSDPEDEFTHPLAMFVDYSTTSHEPEEFILDDIITAKVVLIAGSAGVGKTTQIIPLAARVAHLCPGDDPLRPVLRRRVIYITEDEGQVQRILASMRAGGVFDGIDDEEVRDWFRIVKASRMPADKIVKVAGYYKELAHTNNNPVTGASFVAMPLVVIDTANATIDLMNENDNAEVGKTVACVKQNLGCPAWIIGHLAKALKRADVRDMSARGANAWEGDVNQVLYLVNSDDKDPDNDERWLEVKGAKHRFVSKADGINFRAETHYVRGRDVMGNFKEERLRHATPTVFAIGEKKQAQDIARRAEEREKADALGASIIKAVQKLQADFTYATGNEVWEQVGGNRPATLSAVESLVEAGKLARNTPAGFGVAKRNNAHKYVLRLPTTPEAYRNASS